MNLFNKFVFEYSTGRRKNPNLSYKFKDEDNVIKFNIGNLSTSIYKESIERSLYGKVLDVGAGIGRHSRLVPNTYSIDISKVCCDYMRSRGFNVIEDDILNHHDKYDSLIVTLYNIGMAGDYDNTIKLINHLKSLLNENGQIIFDYNRTLEETKVKELSWLDDNGVEENESQVRTYLCEADIKKIAEDIGMHFEIIKDYDNGVNLGRFYYNTTTYFISATSRSGHNFFMDMIKSWQNGIILYNKENTTHLREGEKPNNIIFLRDYLNTLASLSKFIKKHEFREEKIIKHAVISYKYLLIESLKSNNNLVVHYEKFKSNKEYREDICNIIGGDYNESKLYLEPKFSAPSSFDSRENIDDRWIDIMNDKKVLEIFIRYLKNNLDVLALYIEHYKPSKRKLNFIYKYVTDDYNRMNKTTNPDKLILPFSDVCNIMSESGTFLDLGCGIGNVMLLAKKMFPNYVINGIDKNKDYIGLTQHYKGINGQSLNILDNKTNELISDADIIYAYEPLYPEELILMFENLKNNMKSGAFFIYNSEFDANLIGFETIKKYEDTNIVGAPQHITIFKKI